MGAGAPGLKEGMSISRFSFNTGMTASRTAMYSADADLLIVP